MTNLTYAPTLIEKLLGGWYKWWYISKYSFNSNLSYRATALFVILRDLMPMFISLTIYGSFLDTSEFVSYFLIGNLFVKIITLFADINWEIRHAIAYGGISKFLIRPTSWLKYEFFACIGGNLFTTVVNITVFTFLMLGYGVSFNFGLNTALSIAMLILAITIYFCIDLIVGSVTFWTPETNTLIELKSIITPFLAGSLVFLSTNFITQSFAYLPWSFMVHHPMQIYLGKYDTNQTILVFLGGIVWCVLLYFLAKLVFKLGLKRNESVGL